MGYRVHKTENFFTRHVKLLTFLITVGVFLAIFGPIMVLEADSRWGHTDDTRPLMTSDDLIALQTSSGGAIQWKKLTQYACDENEQEGEGLVLLTVDIAPHYTMIATGNINTGLLEYGEILSNQTGERANILTDDLRAYFAAN